MEGFGHVIEDSKFYDLEVMIDMFRIAKEFSDAPLDVLELGCGKGFLASDIISEFAGSTAIA